MAASSRNLSARGQAELYNLPANLSGLARSSFREAISPPLSRAILGTIAFLLGPVAWVPYLVQQTISKSPYNRLAKQWRPNLQRHGLKRYHLLSSGGLEELLSQIKKIVAENKNAIVMREVRFRNAAFVCMLIRGGTESIGLTKLIVLLKAEPAGLWIDVQAYKRYLAPGEPDENPTLDSATYCLIEKLFHYLTEKGVVTDSVNPQTPIFPRPSELVRNKEHASKVVSDLIMPVISQTVFKTFLISAAFEAAVIALTVLLYIAALHFANT
jgi:hypothetical protein